MNYFEIEENVWGESVTNYSTTYLTISPHGYFTRKLSVRRFAKFSLHLLYIAVFYSITVSFFLSCTFFFHYFKLRAKREVWKLRNDPIQNLSVCMYVCLSVRPSIRPSVFYLLLSSSSISSVCLLSISDLLSLTSLSTSYLLPSILPPFLPSTSVSTSYLLPPFLPPTSLSILWKTWKNFLSWASSLSMLGEVFECHGHPACLFT